MDTAGLSVSTVLWDGHPMETALDAVATAGLTRVEPAFIDGYVAFTEDDLDERSGTRLRAAIESRGLSVHGVSAHIDLGRVDAPERIARRIRFAAALGAVCLVSNAGAADEEAAILNTIDGARALLEESGVVLALENPGHGAGNLIPTGAAGARLLERLGRPDTVRLNYDLGNAWSYNGGRLDQFADLEMAAPYLVFAHLKDVAARGEDWHFVPPGSGDVGLPPLIERLATLRPQLVSGLEMPLRLWRPGRGDPVRRSEPLSLSEIDAALSRTLRAFS